MLRIIQENVKTGLNAYCVWNVLKAAPKTRSDEFSLTEDVYNMTIEEKVFAGRRFEPRKMLDFGFIKTGGAYRYETDFMNGDFSATVIIFDNGAFDCTVVDKMNDEEYRPLRIDSFSGGYVNSVRLAYEALLESIAGGCCKDVLFASDQANRIAERISEAFGVAPDFPWKQSKYESCGVFRHADNLKWFALIMNVKWNCLLKNKNEETVDIINLKINTEEGEALRARDGIYPAYHMNHKNWISVLLNDTLSDAEVLKLAEKSFSLTAKKKRK